MTEREYRDIGSDRIEYEKDVSHCLDYFSRQWNTAEVKDIFRQAREHRYAHFEHNTYHYILEHLHNNTFFLYYK